MAFLKKSTGIYGGKILFMLRMLLVLRKSKTWSSFPQSKHLAGFHTWQPVGVVAAEAEPGFIFVHILDCRVL